MSIVQRRIVLTGGRKNFHGQLGPFFAASGVITLEGSDGDVLGWTRYIEMMWQGFPEGDPRIAETEAAIAAALEAEKENANVQRTVPQGGAVPNGATNLQGAGQPVGSGAGAAPANDGSGAGATATGTAGGLPGGDGQPPELNEKLKAAVLGLSHDDDANWTADLKPAISAVSKAYGSTGITRADVDAVAPGYRRHNSTPQ